VPTLRPRAPPRPRRIGTSRTGRSTRAGPSGTIPTVLVRVKRVREQRADDDGARVLVDRLWPRGLAKADADHDEWLPDVAPSTELRTWFGHAPERFDEFARRYRAELDAEPAASALAALRTRAAAGPLTLLTATRDVEHSHARALADVLATAGST
jgi:uncharacterized protein YeaO (DUF488 family)